jgi:hypothetical protein
MTLLDFLLEFVEKNSLVRLVYPNDEKIFDSWDDCDLREEYIRSLDFEKYHDKKFIGVTSIHYNGDYQDAINIVIEK